MRHSLSFAVLLLLGTLCAKPVWALKHVYAETMPGYWVDQSDVVRLPNVSAQVAYYVAIREVSPVIMAPAPFISTYVHPADRDEARKQAQNAEALLPTFLLPAFEGRGGIRVAVTGWIGGGNISPSGRLDTFGSFMPQQMPAKVRWQFEKQIPRKFKGPSATILSDKAIEYDFPQAKILHRTVAYLPFLLSADDPAQDAKITVSINGHELKPLRVRFTGAPLRVPEYRPD